VLAAATGARNGELCGLEWPDLDLDAGTVRFRQELTNVDTHVLPGTDSASGRRKELAVGPVKSKASKAILTLPPFAVQALRAHRRQQARLRLAAGQPATIGLRWVEPGQPPPSVELDLVSRTQRGTPVNPNHASRAFTRLAASVGLAAHPHMLRHALASATAAEKNQHRSSPRSSATPTAARSPSASTSTNSPRPRPGSQGSSKACSAPRRGMLGRSRRFRRNETERSRPVAQPARCSCRWDDFTLCLPWLMTTLVL
jgi:integrase